MERYKAVFASKTFWAILISFLAKILLYFQVIEISDDNVESIANWLANTIPFAVGAIADAVAFYGRFHADKPLALNPEKKAAAEDAKASDNPDHFDPDA